MFYLFSKEDFAGLCHDKSNIIPHKTVTFILSPSPLLPCQLLGKLKSDTVTNILHGKFL